MFPMGAEDQAGARNAMKSEGRLAPTVIENGARNSRVVKIYKEFARGPAASRIAMPVGLLDRTPLPMHGMLPSHDEWKNETVRATRM